MKEYPAIVARYEEFDSEDPFDPIRLCGAITNPKDYDKSKHGILSTVIEYHTAYCHQNGSPFKLTLALGQDMSVNSILGLPSIMACELQARWKQSVVMSHEFQIKFGLEFIKTRLSSNTYALQRNYDSSNQQQLSPLNISPQFRSTFSSDNAKKETIVSSSI